MANVQQINDFKDFLAKNNIKYASGYQEGTEIYCIIIHLGNGGFSNTDIQLNFTVSDVGFVTFLGPLCKIDENKFVVELYNCNRLNQDDTLYEKFYIDEDDCLCMKAPQDFVMKNQMASVCQYYIHKYVQKEFVDKFLDGETHNDWRK